MSVGGWGEVGGKGRGNGKLLKKLTRFRCSSIV